MDVIKELETITGYRFKNADIACQALTHSSYAKTKHMPEKDYERLEFLGDAVLELTVSQFLFSKFPTLREGEMTRIRSSLVREESLFKAAKKLGIDRIIRIDDAEEKIGGRDKPSILSDIYEALIAALFLDAGFAEAENFIKHTLLFDLKKDDLLPKKDSKTLLQEIVQAHSKTAKITYDVLETSGPDHMKIFRMEVCINGIACGEGVGRSKLEASENAASLALKKIENARSLNEAFKT